MLNNMLKRIFNLFSKASARRKAGNDTTDQPSKRQINPPSHDSVLPPAYLDVDSMFK